MKYFILFSSILIIFTSCEMQDNTLTQENVEQVVLAKERQALDHWAQGNPDRFSVNFAEDVTYFDDIAAHTRIDSLKEMQNYLNSLKGKIPPHSYEIVDPKVQVYGDVAILTLRYHPTSTEGEPGIPWKATSVYKLNSGEWKVVHAHWSLVKE